MMNRITNLKVLISGGGTGGHIFPAIAIANALKAEIPSAKIRFVGAQGKMEMQKVPQAGYPIDGLWISGLKRELTVTNLAFPFKVISSLLGAYKIIKNFKPDVVIGTGGYASGPTLRVAGWMGIPTMIQEQNSFPGITNKMLAGKAKAIFTAYDGMEMHFPANKIHQTGNPIRREMINIEGKRDLACSYFNLDPNLKTLFIVGGSQGARSINLAIEGSLSLLEELGIQMVWQTGTNFLVNASSAIKKGKHQHFKAVDFIREMDMAYAAADVVVSRAGAMAIAELAATGKPTIFVPLPTAAEDHQRHNAEALVKHNAAIMVADKDVNTLLAPTIANLINNSEKCKTLSENILKLAKPDADAIIASTIINLLSNPKTEH